LVVSVIAWTSVAATALAGETQATEQRPQAEVAVPPPSPRALEYYRSGNVLWVVGTVFGLAIPALLLFTGISARLRTLAYRIGRRWLPSLAVYAVLVTLLIGVLGVPLAFYRGFVRQHAYGLSNQSLEKWATDWLIGIGLSAVGLALVLWIPYLLLRRSPKRWWLYAGLATAPLATFVLLISPLWVDPLFNEFGRMKNAALEERILKLADRAGIPESRVYEVRKSADTRTVNAYVTGLGRTKRIVLWDTLLEKLSPDEIEFVMAHEMGHFVLRHVLTGIVVITLLATLSFYVIHRSAQWIIRRYGRSFGFDHLSDPASFPLLLLLGTLVSLAASPLVLALSRHQEHEADRFALELTRNNRAAATAFIRLQQENLAVPRPGALYQLWRGSHPSLGDRVDFANRYRPWETGRPLRYGQQFR
jgi:STE24 endopeptidase